MYRKLFRRRVNSQAPDVPELAHQGIFQLSRLSANWYVKTMKKYPLHLKLTDFMKILSVLLDHCESHRRLFYLSVMWSKTDQSETSIMKLVYAKNKIIADRNRRNFLKNFSWVFPRSTHEGASIELSFV